MKYIPFNNEAKHLLAAAALIPGMILLAVLGLGNIRFAMAQDHLVAVESLHNTTFSASSAASNLADGLVAYYSFDDGTATDNSDNENHGTIHGTPQVVDGAEGLALRFGGYYDPDHIIVPNSGTLSFYDDFTFSGCFNIKSYTSMDPVGGGVTEYGAHSLIAKSGDRNGPRLGVRRSNEDDLLYPYVKNGRCCGYSAGQRILWTQEGNGIDLNEWHMVAFTHSGEAARLYLDGILQEEQAASEFNLNPSMANQPVHIGIGQNATWYPLNGILDEVRIYNRALSEVEIQDLYQLLHFCGKHHRLHLPLALRNYVPPPAFPVHIGDTISQRPAAYQGEIFYTKLVQIPNELPLDGRFYFSSQPSAVAAVLVDDELAILLGGTKIFAYDFSTSGLPEPAYIEIPRTTMEELAGQTVTVEYRDVHGIMVKASTMWLAWMP